MKYNKKDEARRKKIYAVQYKRLLCLFLRSHLLFDLEIRSIGTSFLASLPREAQLSRHKNRCVITGRGRSVHRKFRVSRIILKEMVGYGLLPGYHNASF